MTERKSLSRVDNTPGRVSTAELFKPRDKQSRDCVFRLKNNSIKKNARQLTAIVCNANHHAASCD